MTESEERWAGKLGDEYVKRNYKNLYLRAGFWGNIKRKYKTRDILEVGCGDGHNLYFLHNNITPLGTGNLNDVHVKKLFSYGIDVNKKAIEVAHGLGCKNVCYGSVLNIPFKDNFFDLVFTAGLLIHIPPKDIKKAMKEIIRVSKRYILAIEYYANKERERPFLGEMGITWERPYNDLYTGLGLHIVEAGFLTKQDGFNNLNYWMFKKGKQ